MWQYSAEKLPIGMLHDWPFQGLVSSPLVEGDRMWFVSNRHEVVCLDARGFFDGENDGPWLTEPVTDLREADVVPRVSVRDAVERIVGSSGTACGGASQRSRSARPCCH
jgi:hypothetical protein